MWLIMYSMDAKGSFNDFVLNELNDSSSSDDDEIFYFEVVKIAAYTLIDELIHHGTVLWIYYRAPYCGS
jgi:hypothetical protein